MTSYINVGKNHQEGRLGDLSREHDLRDSRAIRGHLQAALYAKRIKASAIPNYSRQVLVNIWERPRTTFSKQQNIINTASGSKYKIGNKLFRIPWSEEAYEHLKQTRSAEGLTLEHVTPIKVIWDELCSIHRKDTDPNSDPGETWDELAIPFLRRAYSLAVITTVQSNIIDSKEVGLKQRSQHPTLPFSRYATAIEKHTELAKSQLGWAPFMDVKRFVIPDFRHTEASLEGMNIN